MIVSKWKGYQEGLDITDIPADYFAYPSKNVMIYKGKAYKRAGTEYFGAEDDADNKIHGEYTWKDAQIGEIAVRTEGQKMLAWLEPYKTGAGWVEIFDAFDSAVQRVRFATFIDANDSTVHTRLIFVDGSEDVYQWNGAVGVVASVASDTITIAGSKTCEALGFDDGSGTPQTVIINGTEYTYDNDPTAQDIELTSTPSGVSAGDLVIAKPTVSVTTLNTFKKDHVFSFKNHVVLGNLESGQLYFSHISDYPLNFTVPAPASRTAATAFFVNLDGNVTVTTIRKDKMWVSTEDDWFKITKLDSVNSYDLYVEVEKVETTERNGALPFCVGSYKGDTIFVTQDKTLQMITDNDIVQEDAVKLISDEIALLLKRLDMTDARLVVHDRYFYIICPVSATTLMYDTVENFWQPPQEIGMGLLSIIGGLLIGHSNARNASFYLFKGRQDLGIDFEAVFALGYVSMGDEFVYKQFSKTGIAGRVTESAEITWETEYEVEGERAKLTRKFKGTDMKLFTGNTLTPWGTVPYGTVPWAGQELPDDSDVKRFFFFDNGTNFPFFEYRPIITVSGDNAAFQLTGYMVDERAVSRTVGKDHYIKT